MFQGVNVPDWSCKHLLAGLYSLVDCSTSIHCFRVTTMVNQEITLYSFPFGGFADCDSRWDTAGFLFNHCFIKTVKPALKATHEKGILFHVVVVDVYISELKVQSNATLEAPTILAILTASTFQVTAAGGVSYTVTIEQTQLVAGMTGFHTFIHQLHTARCRICH